MSSEHVALAAGEAPAVSAAPSSRGRARLVAAALAAAAVVAGVNLLARPLPADDFNEYAAAAPVRDALWTFATVAAVSTAIAYIAVGLAVCLLAPSRGAVWASAGAVCTALGGVGYAAGFFATGAIHWYATSTVIPAEAGTALLRYAGEQSGHVFGPQVAGFLAFVIGYVVLLAVALWRSGSVPRWLPIAIPVTFLAAMLAGTGVAFDVANAAFMATMVAIAWSLWVRGTRAHRTVTA
jgi:hypothetical protein